MDESFVPNLLRTELETREERLSKVNDEVHRMRNKIAHIQPSGEFSNVYWLRKEMEVYEKARRELRGEVSALRQAIARLERSE
jgi:predicted  nucleic acid-binding Zn-ribbon protein